MKTVDAEKVILEAMRKDPTAKHYGLSLMDATGVRSGSLYPALRRLQDQNLVEGVWEEEPCNPKRIRRRYYKLKTKETQ